LPEPLNEIGDDFLDIFFEFANTYTVESVRHGFQEGRKERESAPEADVFREMGYSEEDIAGFDM
jgi:hypothetical protein